MDNKPYVFISYAHVNSKNVMPCIMAMQNAGINLWFNEGIEAGSEWPEYIAMKVVSCSKFVLFVSNAYLTSQNCKRELNFAISRKKDILTVFIEDVRLTPGMEMQLGTYQAMRTARFSNSAQFYKSLCSERFFDKCRLGNDTKTYNTGSNETPPKKANTGSGYSPNRQQYTAAPARKNRYWQQCWRYGLVFSVCKSFI